MTVRRALTYQTPRGKYLPVFSRSEWGGSAPTAWKAAPDTHIYPSALSDAVTRVRIGKTPDGRRIEESREIPVPADRAWSLLVDTERWPEWGPSVRSIDCSDREIRAGSTGHVETPVGIRVPFEITACEPYRWTWRVARIPAPGHRVESLGPERCRVFFEVPLLAGAYVPVCRWALCRIAEMA